MALPTCLYQMGVRISVHLLFKEQHILVYYKLQTYQNIFKKEYPFQNANNPSPATTLFQKQTKPEELKKYSLCKELCTWKGTHE